MKKSPAIFDIWKQLKFEIQRGLVMPYIKTLSDPNYNYKIDFDVFLPSIGKNLQRPFCWTLEQKQELILSILKGLKLAPIAVLVTEFKDGTVIYRVIDGKQRLSTILSFYNNEFPVILNGEEYYYNECHETVQGQIKLLNLISDRSYDYEGEEMSDEDKIAWFEQINFAGTPQDKNHILNLKNSLIV